MRRAGLWAIVLGAIVLYGPGLGGGLIWDDFGYVFLGAYWHDRGWGEALGWFFFGSRELYPMGTYRPVLELSFVVEYGLWGVDALGYRVTNLLLHVGCSLLLVSVVARLGASRFAAWIAGVLFALSPAHPEACMWLSCRVNLLAAFCMLAAIRAHFAGHRARSVVWALLAFGSKETAYVVPPLLSWWAWVSSDAVGGWKARSVAVLRSTAAMWVAIGVVLALRFLALGEFVGGYTWREPPALLSWAYVVERLELLMVTFSPVNSVRNPEWFRYVLLAVQGLAWSWLLVTAVRGERAARRVARFAIGWLALANVPIYNAPFEPGTLVDLRSSRLLYEPMLAVVAGVALCVSRFSLRRSSVAFGVFAFAVAVGNVGPWCETERIARQLEVVMRDDPLPDGPAWFVDLPAVHDGAFLFPGNDPVVTVPFARPGAVERLTFARDKQWAAVLHRIDEHVRSGRADGLVVRRLEAASRFGCRFAAEPVASELPVDLADGIVLRVARCRGFDVRVGGTAGVDVLVSGAAVGAGRTVRAVLASGGTEYSSEASALPVDDGVHSLSLEVRLPADARPGRYALRIGLDGSAPVPISTWVDVQSARTWPD